MVTCRDFAKNVAGHTGGVRIVVGGDNAPLAERMARLSRSYGAEVTITGDGFPALIEMAERERPDVAVTTVGPLYADYDKVRTALGLRRRNPATGVMLVSPVAQVVYTRELVAAGGGVGYVSASSFDRPADVVLALRRVVAGKFGLDRAVIGNLVGSTWVPELRGLNRVEREVVDLVAGGWPDDAIAARLWFGEATVVKVVGEVFEKLGLEPVPDPARRAYAMLSLAADRTRPRS